MKDLFDQTIQDEIADDFNIDTEEVEIIDMEEIDDLSQQDSIELVNAFTGIDKNVLESQPRLIQKIKQYKDALRMHFKILKSSERAYDILINNIAKSPANASLYTALTRLQASMVDARVQISNTMTSIEGCMNTIELEINFESSSDDSTEENGITTRGMRDLIKGLKDE